MWNFSIMANAQIEKIHIVIRKKNEIKSSTWEETTAIIFNWSLLGGDRLWLKK